VPETSTRTEAPGFEPPAYPYDRLDDLRMVAASLRGGCVDLSIGTPRDPPPPEVVEALARSGEERGYPSSPGSAAFRTAAAEWLARRFGVTVVPEQVAACIGTKELVAGLPHWLRLRTPNRDTVLYPAVSYPTYAMGATLARCRAVAVPVDERWRLQLDAVDEEDAARALCLWVNSPGNPAGGLDDLRAAAQWGRERGVPVLSDECYVEFTWDGRGRTVLEAGNDGVIAVHSLSKRSNLAGVRVGFYAGDATLVRYLSELRRHAGFMVPGPGQAAAVVAWADDKHVEVQRERYRRRLEVMRDALATIGVDAPLPGGGFYLWAPAADNDGWALARQLAERGGVLVSPGELYGDAGRGHVRIAMVESDERLELVCERLADSSGRFRGSR
jgi:succinyldiaminopimelate transaminase